MLSEPRGKDHTTWTATAPEAVSTVRTYATRRDYGQRLSAQIRRSLLVNQQVTVVQPGPSHLR